MHSEHSLTKDQFKSLQNDFDFLSNLSLQPKQKSLWERRLDVWFSKLSNNGQLCEEKLKNFRNLSVLLSEVPRNPYNQHPILGPIYNYLRRPGYRKTCLHNFTKLSQDQSLDWEAFSDIGKPLFEEQNGKRFNERFLRHLRTLQLIKTHVPLSAGDLVVDVGGGYGQFISMLLKQNTSTRALIIDLPQQLFLARYFLQNTNPYLKINSIKQAYQPKFYDLENLNTYDILLVPAQF
ncbi:MAG: putative sugar O-methyltransferase, partial [Emcibacteraceae bacterium]|nr:putative sugar O-methyltransferase [Emcibacteraceae bacterium]